MAFASRCQKHLEIPNARRFAPRVWGLVARAERARRIVVDPRADGGTDPRQALGTRRNAAGAIPGVAPSVDLAIRIFSEVGPGLQGPTS